MIFSLLPIATFAQNFAFTPNLQNAYAELTKFKLQNAKELLAKEPSNNGIKIWQEDFADMITLFTTENEKEYERLESKEDERLDAVEKIEPNSPYNRWIRAEIKFHWALIRMKLGHDTKAGFNAIAAYKLLEENNKLFPNFTPNLKTLGVLHIFVGSVPENYRWITKFLGLKGNIRQGIRELDMASQDKIFGNETKFYKFFLQANVLGFTDKNRTELADFVNKNPDNLAISFLGTSLNLRDNNARNAFKIMQNRPTDDVFNLPIFDLYKGDILLQKGAYPQAIISYNAYLRNFHGSSYLKDIQYKLFLCHYLNKDVDRAKAMLYLIPNVGKKTSESDKFAQRFFENFQKTKNLPNRTLLKAKLAFEGGHNEESLALLESLNEDSFETISEKAEFHYSKGRVLQKINNFNQAISSYERSVSLSEDQNWYYAPFSCLQLGLIYEAKNDKSRAKNCFEKAILYKKHEFKNSIDNKAQAALASLGV
ncbi:MAG: hypothetical protein V4585_18750 [Bacteroidota bacterium]